MKAYYDDVHKIQLVTSQPLTEKVFYGDQILEVMQVQEEASTWVYTLSCPELPMGEPVELVIGEAYVLVCPRMIVKTSWFDEKYACFDQQLGSWILDDRTYFAVWAPTATDVQLKLDGRAFPMQRDAHGVYTVQFEQNLHGSIYAFAVITWGVAYTTTDPYAKASMPNRGGSIVVDFDQLDLSISDFKPEGAQTVLEMHVRDFSMDPDVNFTQRGNFLGLLESDGSFGFNHVKDLGISHVQIMPVNDFETVDELNPSRKYNWGYDPMQYMVLEGSYSSNVKDPHQVIKDFAKVVDTYHQHNIGVNLDVVFNHVYKQQYHPLNILVPYYYFRYKEDLTLSDGSFCGNELASEVTMCRKLIVDTCDYFVNTFKVDGFRFDLMGLTDVDTMNLIHNRHPEIMLYGEGWKMPTVLEENRCASMENQHLMPTIGFFNDLFRNTIGGSLDGEDLGFAGNRRIPKEHVIASITGNADPQYRPTLFTRSMQSVNYVECHDNLTVADRVMMNHETYDKALFMIGVILMSQGVAFLQIGQSFFRDKQGDHNSYQSPDAVNMIRWDSLSQYHDMNEQVKAWIEIRKNMYKFQEGYTFEAFDNNFVYRYGVNEWRVYCDSKVIEVSQSVS